jgi:formylmethanofuran dehydrogenase subunit D
MRNINDAKAAHKLAISRKLSAQVHLKNVRSNVNNEMASEGDLEVARIEYNAACNEVELASRDFKQLAAMEAVGVTVRT